MALLLDEILNEDDTTISFKGEKFKIFPTFKALLKYQAALEKYQQDKNDENFAESLGIAIFGDSDNYNKFNELIKEHCNPLQSQKAWTLILKKWMQLLGLDPEKKQGETNKKKVEM